jgi:hypothetical protein
MTTGLSIVLAIARRARSLASVPARMTRRYARSLALLLALGSLLVALPPRAGAAGLECPELGPGGIPDLLAGAPQLERMTTANTVDLADEINGLINKLKTDKPGISNDDITNVLIAAFCPVVARLTQLSGAEKWRLMHRFDTVLMQQIAANTMPSGSLIIASVPLAPEVFRDLTTKAEAAGQQPAQFMAAILAKAVGR